MFAGYEYLWVVTELHDLEAVGPDFSKLNGREALQQLVDLKDTTQFTVNDDDDDDPILLTLPERNVVDTWREDYPYDCLLYTSPSPRDRTRSRMPSSA